VKVAFLDRDGVLNLKPADAYYVTRLDQLELAPGAAAGVAALNRAGYLAIVVTNQRAVARGLLSLEALAAMHDKLQQEVRALGGRIEQFYVCPHEKGVCNCRKPLPGMFLDAFRDRPEIDRETSFFIGDSDSDRAAAEAAGLRFYPLETNGSLLACLRERGLVPAS